MHRNPVPLYRSTDGPTKTYKTMRYIRSEFALVIGCARVLVCVPSWTIFQIHYYACFIAD